MTYVELIKEIPLVSTLTISEEMNVGHKAVIQLVRNYISDFEDLGTLTFEMAKSQGRPTRFCWLNEEQCIFVCTLMKNSKKAVEFKKQVSIDFMKMRRKLIEISERQQNSEWIEQRKTGKLSRKEETDVIQFFIEYAMKQGSKNALRYYGNISRMENKALFIIEHKFKNVRDVLDGQQLAVINTCDQIVAKALRDGIHEGLFYKDIYQKAKEEVLKFVDLVGTSYVPKQKQIKKEGEKIKASQENP